jgi:hypothetical protein
LTLPLTPAVPRPAGSAALRAAAAAVVGLVALRQAASAPAIPDFGLSSPVGASGNTALDARPAHHAMHATHFGGPSLGFRV